jgi:protein-disulfide isomerase
VFRPAGSSLLALTMTLSAAAWPAAQRRPAATPASDSVAVVGDRLISAAELDAAARDRLLRVRNDEYAVRRQALDELIARVLIERGAAARGLAPDEFMRLEIDLRVAAPTDEHARAVFDSDPSRYRGQPFDRVASQIRASLIQARTADAKRRLLADLKEQADVRLLLEPPRAIIDTPAAPARGRADAAVTILEFSDFQCPFCRSATETLKRIETAFAGDVRLVFIDFPLPIHADAPRAAEAAACADEQGRFWDMHDALFASQSALRQNDLERRAEQIGLDAARFQSCLASGRHTARWQQGRALGQRHGVAATPTFFVNGRMVTGAIPYETFREIVREERDRVQRRTTSDAGSQSPEPRW